MKFSSLCSSIFIATSLLTAPALSWAQSAEKGKETFVKNGCWQCHGFLGQGGVTGPKLAPDPKSYDYIAVFVRHTNGAMPPYSEKILSKEDLADIYAFLKSVPKGPDYKSIPILN